MSIEEIEYTCTNFPRWLSPHVARELLPHHSWHTCDARAAAQAVIDGEHSRPWNDLHTLQVQYDWLSAYRDLGLPVAYGEDRSVEFVADDTMTAVLMPHALAAWVNDRIGYPVPTLAPPLPRLSTQPWAFLATPETITDTAVEQLRKHYVTILEPGQRLRLPTTRQPQPATESWWYQWPRRHGKKSFPRVPYIFLLNESFRAARSRYRLYVREATIVFEPLPNTYVQVNIDDAAAAGIRARSTGINFHQAASQLITVGARILQAAGADGEILVRDTAHAMRVVEIDDALTTTVSGTWPPEYEVRR